MQGDGISPDQELADRSLRTSFQHHQHLVGIAPQIDRPLLDASADDGATADRVRHQAQVPALTGKHLDLDRVGMIGFRKGLDSENDLHTYRSRPIQGVGEPFPRQGPIHQPGDEPEIAPLLAIHLGKGAAGIEGEGRRQRLSAQQTAGQPADVVGSGRMRAGRSAHNGAQDVVENADLFHSLLSFTSHTTTADSQPGVEPCGASPAPARGMMVTSLAATISASRLPWESSCRAARKGS